MRQSTVPEQRNVLYGVYREELRLRLHSWLQRWKLRKRYSHPGGVLGALQISSDGDDRTGEKSKPKKKIPRAQTKSKKNSCWISEKAFNDHTKMCLFIIPSEVFRIWYSHSNNSRGTQEYLQFQQLYCYMRNFYNLIGLEQWYFSLIWNT